jgi:hypothetical protein
VAPGVEYESRREGRWRLLVRPDAWRRDLWVEVLDRLASVDARKHPQTIRLGAGPTEAERYFLKVYSPARGAGAVKDLFRVSKAMRALRQGAELARSNFHAPEAVAAGEERTFGALGRAFLLTPEIAARPLAAVLRERYTAPLDRAGVRAKRRWLAELALETRGLHQRGFVHGDLIPSNIMARAEADGGATFFFMDNDRTRRYPAWLPHRLWRRNLVQLNRVVLPGISLQDRMRFLRIYLGGGPWRDRERRLIRWLEKRTRRRRKECERIEAKVSFRELMRWNGPFAKKL